MKQYKYKEYIVNIIPCMYNGIVCGAVAGAAVFLFKFCAAKAEELSRLAYSAAKVSPLYIALAFAVLILLGTAMYFLHKFIPEVKGGGIPRSEGVLRGVLSFRWLKTLVGTFVGSMISFICGAPLGSEGPAVLMGTSIGNACSISKNKTTWGRYVMTGGAGAGFAVATGAPLSGILFALEEIHKRFTPMLVLTVSTSVISATYVNYLLCSLFGINANLFHIGALPAFELDQVGYLLILGVAVALAVGVFDASISVFGTFTAKFKKLLSPWVKIVFVFILTGILGFFFTDGAYSGHHLIDELLVNDKTFWLLAAILAIRLLMMVFITDSGVTGGIFIPTLAIGALVAAIAGKLLLWLGLSPEMYTSVVLLGMCAFIGGTLRAPITATVLFIELTGQFFNLFYVALVVFAVGFITEMFNFAPFYDIALEKMEHEQNHGRSPVISCFELKVSKGAFVVGKSVRDIMWPYSSVVVGITRADETVGDMDNGGEKKIYVGDTLLIRAKYYDESELLDLLRGLVGSEFEITKTEIS